MLYDNYTDEHHNREIFECIRRADTVNSNSKCEIRENY